MSINSLQPFEAPATICDKLLQHNIMILVRNNDSVQLRRVDNKPSLPGQARIQLNNPELLGYLRTEHLTPDLNRLIIFVRKVSRI
jgi:hypothetical protein